MEFFTFRSIYFDYVPTERGSYKGLWLKADGEIPLPDSLDVGAVLTLELKHASAVEPYSEDRAAWYYLTALDGATVVVEEIIGERVRVSLPTNLSIVSTFGFYTYGVARFRPPAYSARALMRYPYAP